MDGQPTLERRRWALAISAAVALHEFDDEDLAECLLDGTPMIKELDDAALKEIELINFVRACIGGMWTYAGYEGMLFGSRDEAYEHMMKHFEVVERTLGIANGGTK